MIEHGNLIFIQFGSDLNAISAVTKGYRHALLNHMGVAVKNSKGVFVLEAFPPEVRVTQLEVFLRRSNDLQGNPRFMAGRLLPQHRHLIPAAIGYGLTQRNKPYDQLYLTEEDALYCSELVVDMFKTANGGATFFEEHPMSFRDKTSGEILPAWIAYYKHFGIAVPDGDPGSNPGDISKDPRLEIFLVQGKISGYVSP